jgi:hypothetical protein
VQPVTQWPIAVLEGCRSLLRRLRQRDHGQGRQYTPRLWSVFISAPLALVVAAGAAVLIYRRLSGSSLVGKATPLDVTKTALTIVGAIGAVLVGVYSYRKQRLEEGAANRADADQFTGRYNSAADQLGSEKAAVRLAGVYAMARLADDWKDQRQVCVDVLCAYLRMPETGAVDPGEAQVRQTIVRVIATHLQETADGKVSWSSLDFDLTQAVFNRNTRFDGATFAGKSTRFDGATFAGKSTSFDRATFAGESTSFDGATFAGEFTSFAGATFAGRYTGFIGATFAGEFTSFAGATFAGRSTGFDGATFAGRYTGFIGATFAGEVTRFDRATFAEGSTVSFMGIDLKDQASITKDGHDFRGWPEV